MSMKVPKMRPHENDSILTNKSKKSRASRVSIQELRSQSVQIEIKDVGPHVLSPEYIILRGKGMEKLLSTEKNLIVPPSSPRSDFMFDKHVDTIPVKLNNITELKIPYVRVLGIKKTIDVLGEFFGCTLYRTSHLQFWFLDMVADCLWKCQDEFLLNENYQKIVLNWVLYFFNLIRDSSLNLSRCQFYRILRETMILAEERIECGDEYFPTPEELFTLESPTECIDDFETLSNSSDSSSPFDDSSSDDSFLVMPSEEYPDIPDFYRLPSRECKCDIYITSSLETLSEKSIHIEDKTQPEESDPHCNSEADVNDVEMSFSVSEFYQPDPEIHSRFFDKVEEDDEESAGSNRTKQNGSSDVEYEWVNEFETLPPILEKPKSTATITSQDAPTAYPSIRKIRNSSTKSRTRQEKTDRRSTQDDTASISTLTMKKSKGKVAKQEKKLTEKELLRAWFEYNLLEQRKEDMARPNKGWKPYEPEICTDDCICSQMEYTMEDFESEEYVQIKNEWMQYLDKYKMAIDQINQNIFVNSCLLLIIKQVVFEYFHESFQYKLIKMTYQTVPNLTYEKLNKKWLVPKQSRDEFRRPLEKKPKPPKPVKEKRSENKVKKMKEKVDKKSKSSAGSNKKEKKPKVKPEKPHKLTKEEKQELEKVKKEEEQKLKEELVAEENRRFIFPLSQAANEEFFKSIFEDYVSPSDGRGHVENVKNKKLHNSSR